MKLSCLQENLDRGLNIVGRAVATRSTLPITANIYLAAEESRLKLAATNLEMAISCWVGAKVEEEGRITVPARLLSSFVSSLPNDRIDLELRRGRTLTLHCLRNEASINGMDADDFPPIPTIKEGIKTYVDAENLRKGIQRVAFAAATDEARPVLTGVLAEFQENKLTLAAADGFRLAVVYLDLAEPVAEALSIIIPARSLSELNRLLTDQEEPVEITISQTRSQVLFHLKNADLLSQLIQGTFPNYQQLMPQSYNTRTVVELEEFLRATRIAAIFARDASGIVRLQMSPGEEGQVGRLAVSARAEEVGENAGELDALIEGEEAKIAFNVRYLSDALSALEKGQVALETTSPSSPGAIRPIGSQDYIYVVMPMFVQW